MFGGWLRLGFVQCLALLVTVWLGCQALYMIGEQQTYGVNTQKLTGADVPKSDDQSLREKEAVFGNLIEDNITRDCLSWRPVATTSR